MCNAFGSSEARRGRGHRCPPIGGEAAVQVSARLGHLAVVREQRGGLSCGESSKSCCSRARAPAEPLADRRRLAAAQWARGPDTPSTARPLSRGVQGGKPSRGSSRRVAGGPQEPRGLPQASLASIGMAHKNQAQSLKEELTCAICYDLFRDPVMLDCMHHFCKKCIQDYWRKCPRVATCPQCRREFPTRSFRPHYLVAGVVETVRKASSEEHRKRMQKPYREALQSCQKEREKLMRLKHVAEDSLCSLLKTSGELNSKIHAEFEHLHRVLEEEERTVLMELAREEELWVVRLQGEAAHLEEEISDLKKNMEHIQQILEKLGNSLLEVENVVVRPSVQIEALPTFSVEQHMEKYNGPLQYIFWRKMLKSIAPAPAPLTFDPESAHPNLILSKNLTSVTEREEPYCVSSSSSRFLKCVNVLASQSFESGRHYWEVWVGKKAKWDLGVAANSIDRTAKVRLSPKKGYWALRLRDSEYWAAATPRVRLKPQHMLRKVGVLLDCKESKVAFYDAEDMSHLFTFYRAKACKFYPFFSTCFSDGNKNAEPMRICHLSL